MIKSCVKSHLVNAVSLTTPAVARVFSCLPLKFGDTSSCVRFSFTTSPVVVSKIATVCWRPCKSHHRLLWSGAALCQVLGLRAFRRQTRPSILGPAGMCDPAMCERAFAVSKLTLVVPLVTSYFALAETFYFVGFSVFAACFLGCP